MSNESLHKTNSVHLNFHSIDNLCEQVIHLDVKHLVHSNTAEISDGLQTIFVHLFCCSVTEHYFNVRHTEEHIPFALLLFSDHILLTITFCNVNHLHLLPFKTIHCCFKKCLSPETE